MVMLMGGGFVGQPDCELYSRSWAYLGLWYNFSIEFFGRNAAMLNVPRW